MSYLFLIHSFLASCEREDLVKCFQFMQGYVSSNSGNTPSQSFIGKGYIFMLFRMNESPSVVWAT